MPRANSLGSYRSTFYPMIARIAVDPSEKIQLLLPYGKALEMRRRFYHLKRLLSTQMTPECSLLAPFAEQLHIQIKLLDGTSPPNGFPTAQNVHFIMTHDCVFDAAVREQMTQLEGMPGLPSAFDPRLDIFEAIKMYMQPTSVARPRDVPKAGSSPLAEQIAAQAKERDRQDGAKPGSFTYNEIPLAEGETLTITKG